MADMADKNPNVPTKPKSLSKRLAEWYQRNARKIREICWIAILLFLVLENISIWLMVRKRGPLSREQGGIASLQPLPTSTERDIAALKERLAQDEKANAELQSDLRVVTGKLKISQGQLQKAREERSRLNEEGPGTQTAALETSVKAELATKANADDVNRLNGDVTGVESDLDATKNGIQMARSEMGTLIARNHEEVDELRRLGGRDYFEFTITRQNEPQKVGNIILKLKGVDGKKHQYTIEITVDDERFVRANRRVNEPIFFYANGKRVAQEVVINKIEKDRVSGYLSIPKIGSGK